MRRRWRPVKVCKLLAATVVLVAAACGSTPSQLPDGGLPPLEVQSTAPTTILPGTWVHVYGLGFVASTVGTLVVELERGGGNPWIIKPDRLSDTELRIQVSKDMYTSLGGPGSFQGIVRVRADYGGGYSQERETAVSWTLVDSLAPRLDQFTATSGTGPIYLGSEVRAIGAGFLMDGEGRTELRLTGSFTPDGGTARQLDAVPLVLPSGQREELLGPFPAEALGVIPGTFQGRIVPVNVLVAGSEVPGSGLDGVSIELGPTVLNSFSPTSASRGQWIEFYGRGFVAGSARTIIRVEGTFTQRDGQVVDLQGGNSLEIVPDVLAGDHMRYVLRVTPDGHGGVVGLGAVPGLLRGTATPVVYLGSNKQVGVALPGQASFTVLPQSQVVYLSFLPGFTDTLRSFGLRNMEESIRARILEVVQRDYHDFSVDVRAMRPTDFAEYSVVEIGGEDPNGQGLLGLDSTMGKDTGNIYFDDVVGGNNADSRENGHFAFGGVFVDSFLAFSPKSPAPMEGLATPRFDDIFGPFMPSQGGKPVDADEYPGGARVDQIDQAVHAIGSMIGNTVSHEFGHTLGLAAGPPDVFHDLDPLPNQIMNAGSDRPFEERAEIDGQGPEVWAPDDQAYLQEILPR